MSNPRKPPHRKFGGPGSGWRITFLSDAASESAYVRALEAHADAVGATETAPGGPWRVDAYARHEPDRAAVAIRLMLAAASLGQPAPEFKIEALEPVDWLKENRRSFPPRRVGRYLIHGSHDRTRMRAGPWTIELDASIAFGSGEHATTQGCLLAIERVTRRRRRRRRALDLGCGSGILAIALAKAGVARVAALDIDRDAVRLTALNARINRVGARVRVRHGQAPPPGKRYDLIVANILARPLERLSRAIAAATRAQGVVILSGLLAGQEPAVLAAYRRSRFHLGRRVALAGWHTLVLERR